MTVPLVAQIAKNLPAMQKIWIQSQGQEDPLEKENGYPLQYSCLENPRDGGAWLAAIYGVAQSRTRLKQLSSSSSSSSLFTSIALALTGVTLRNTHIWQEYVLGV